MGPPPLLTAGGGPANVPGEAIPPGPDRGDARGDTRGESSGEPSGDTCGDSEPGVVGEAGGSRGRTHASAGGVTRLLQMVLCVTASAESTRDCVAFSGGTSAAV